MDSFDDGIPEAAAHMIRCGHPVHRACLQSSLRVGSYYCAVCRQPLGDPPGPATVSLHLKRYVNMLRSGLPAAAVRQRMIADALPAQEVDAFFTGGASREVEEEEDTTLPLEAARAENIEKFEKMLRVGMNEQAVRLKMESAGLKRHEIDKFFGI